MCLYILSRPDLKHREESTCQASERKLLLEPGGRPAGARSWAFMGLCIIPFTLPLCVHPWQLWCGTWTDAFGAPITLADVIAFQETAFVTGCPRCLALAHPHLCSHYRTKLFHYVESTSGVWSWNIVEVQRLCHFWVTEKCFIHGAPYIFAECLALYLI